MFYTFDRNFDKNPLMAASVLCTFNEHIFCFVKLFQSTNFPEPSLSIRLRDRLFLEDRIEL